MSEIVKNPRFSYFTLSILHFLTSSLLNFFTFLGSRSQGVATLAHAVFS
jgi:hypothetical protein